MRFFIADDDPAIRSMLTQIIEDADLGVVVGEAGDGALVDDHLLAMKKVDILLIDLLMPLRDGIETVRLLKGFEGKTVMISQIESKEMIAEAYSLGIEYYITKPVNRLEVVSVIHKVRERVLLQKSLSDIQKSLSALGFGSSREKREQRAAETDLMASARYLLTELGMIGESGGRDLLDMLAYIHRTERENPYDRSFPSLKEIFYNVALQKVGVFANPADVQKEVKASEQRVRRAINQGLVHLASLGLTDYANPKFETYAAQFFDFTEVRKKMMELEKGAESAYAGARINTKKFIFVLYLEAKRLSG